MALPNLIFSDTDFDCSQAAVLCQGRLTSFPTHFTTSFHGAHTARVKTGTQNGSAIIYALKRYSFVG